uniref:BTB domain-containing protein n=1 Tax=Panagrellus redivivus TaxID=6233 RepID=A0A7E4UUQ4_PANRE
MIMTTITVKDCVTFKVLKSDLTEKKVEEYMETPERCIPCSDNLMWLIRYYPTGRRLDSIKTFCVYLKAQQITDAKMRVGVDGSGTNLRASELPNPSGGWIQYISVRHEHLKQWFKNDKLTITCRVELDITVPLTMHVKPHIFESCEHVPTDFELVVGSNRLPVHKSFLSMISPVFHAMFLHETAENRSEVVEITDIDFGTVKAAIDFCYGRRFQNPTVESVVDVLRFADKYNIKTITNPLEKIPLTSMSIDNFCAIVHYAYDCSKEALFTECSNFYKRHENDIKKVEKFGKLPPQLITELLKGAFNLNTNFDVLRHAHKTGLMFVVTYLEQSLLDSLTLEGFCSTVKYAWEYSRNDLKNVCAKFLNKHRLEITTKNEFFDLPGEIVLAVSKLSLTDY